MTKANSVTGSAPEVVGRDLTRTARTTGLLYLGLAVTGALGFLFVRGQLFVPTDPDGTLGNLIEHQTLARAGIALELGVVVTQALTAMWFYRLFRSVDTFAAGALAAYGLVNAVAILGSAALLATALDAAGDASLAVGGEPAATVQLLYVASGHLWGVGAIFFGLWLIPMGWLVIHSRWLPRPLGWVLVVAGAGYVVSAFVTYLLPAADIARGLLTVPSIVGELWIVGYLIAFGVRGHAAPQTP